MKNKKGPTLRYGFLQAGYWIDYLIIQSFAAVFLAARGFSTSQIGTLTAGSSLLSCVLQQVSGTISDKYEDSFPLKYILALFFGACVVCCMALMILPHAFLPTFAFYFTVLSLQAAINPLLSSISLQFSNNGYDINFGLARSMGSLGYALCGLVMGHITDAFGSEIILPIYIGVYAVLLIILFFFFPIPVKDKNAKIIAGSELIEEKPSTMREFIHKYHRFMVLMIGFIFLWFGNSVLSTYMIYFIKDLGGNAADMGTTLFVMAGSEIPAVLFGNNLMKRIGAPKMLLVSALGGISKSFLFFIAPNVPFFIFLNVTHFFLSGFYQVSAVYYCYAIVGQKDIVKGQAVLGIMVTGIGGMLANWLGGILLEAIPHKSILFITVVTSIIAFFIILYAVNPRHFANEKVRSI